MLNFWDIRLRAPWAIFWLVLLCLLLSQCKGPGHEERLNFLVTQATGGDRQAQFNIARRFETGTGVLQDQEKAKKWYLEAAKGGLAQAQYRLAQLLSTGQLGQPDQKNAVRWYRAAAFQGHVDAQLNLSRRYLQGHGAPIDQDKSVALLQNAARRGHPQACAELAELYLGGSLPHRNDRQAIVLFHQLAQLGRPEYEALLGWLHAFGIGVPFNPDQARSWLEKATEHGYLDARFLLDQLVHRQAAIPLGLGPEGEQPLPAVVRYPIHVLYGNDLQLPIDEKELLHWYRVQASLGRPPAQYELGRCYRYGIGTAPDKERALSWFKRAADQNYLPARLAWNQLQQMSF